MTIYFSVCLIITKLTHFDRDVISRLEMVGLLAVEFFLLASGELLVNEIAPRPHNSGHHTIECCYTSQFAQHLRSILNLPLGDTGLLIPGAMLNVVGEKGYEGPAEYLGLEQVLKMPGVYLHLYGKKYTKPFRKMGHVTVIDEKREEAIRKARLVKEILKVVSF